MTLTRGGSLRTHISSIDDEYKIDRPVAGADISLLPLFALTYSHSMSMSFCRQVILTGDALYRLCHGPASIATVFAASLAPAHTTKGTPPSD